jgi:hypothetical protein
MTKNEKKAAEDLMVDHFKGLEPWNNQNQAKLAFAQGGWKDGTRVDDRHKQYLDFNYHREEHQNSATIGQTVTVVRDRPPPEVRVHDVPKPAVFNTI